MANHTKHILRELTESISVTHYLSHRDYLKAIYDAAKARAASYSYLAFAEDLGFSATNVMRLVIIGQRPLTSKAAETVARGLGLHGPQRRYWTTLIKYGNERLPAERDRLFRHLMSLKSRADPTELTPTQAEYFGEWYHPVIREMTGLADFDGDPEWIRARLMFPLRIEQIRRSLDLLEQIGAIRRDPQLGRLVRSDDRIATQAEVDSLAIVRFHQKMIEIGRESITTVPEADRDIRAVTVTLPQHAIPVLKGKIEEWVLQIAAMERSDERGDQVVQVNVQMFPFTKR